MLKLLFIFLCLGLTASSMTWAGRHGGQRQQMQQWNIWHPSSMLRNIPPIHDNLTEQLNQCMLLSYRDGHFGGHRLYSQTSLGVRHVSAADFPLIQSAPWSYQGQRGFIFTVLGRVYFIPYVNPGRNLSTYSLDSRHYYLYRFELFGEHYCQGFLDAPPGAAFNWQEWIDMLRGVYMQRHCTFTFGSMMGSINLSSSGARYLHNVTPQVLPVNEGRQVLADLLSAQYAQPNAVIMDELRGHDGSDKRRFCHIDLNWIALLESRCGQISVQNSQGLNPFSVLPAFRQRIENHNHCTEYCAEHPRECPHRRVQSVQQTVRSSGAEPVPPDASSAGDAATGP